MGVEMEFYSQSVLRGVLQVKRYLRQYSLVISGVGVWTLILKFENGEISIIYCRTAWGWFQYANGVRRCPPKPGFRKHLMGYIADRIVTGLPLTQTPSHRLRPKTTEKNEVSSRIP